MVSLSKNELCHETINALLMRIPCVEVKAAVEGVNHHASVYQTISSWKPSVSLSETERAPWVTTLVANLGVVVARESPVLMYLAVSP